MKRTSLVVNSILVLLFSIILLNGCKTDYTKKDYLLKVLNNLDKIESATYYNKVESWAPGDTIGPLYTSQRFYKEYSNPEDSTIGSSFVALFPEDTTKLMWCYDGHMVATYNEEEKLIVIDSFKVRSLPFRPTTPPFFNYTKSIIKYALETKDSILTEIKDYGDSIYLRMTILEDKQVEFFGKAFYMKNPFSGLGETTSKYEIWISKSNHLPYRVRREMYHDVSVSTCRLIDLNKLNIEDFNASDYFNPEYTILPYGLKKNVLEVNLLNKNASDWDLKDADLNSIALKDFNSKVLMIQFTGIGCGPCNISIPFLKTLESEYDKKTFDMVSIVVWAKDIERLNIYKIRNDFKYKFLLSTPEVTKNYQIQAVPIFYILDENRVIKKIIKGYSKGTTDQEIIDAINELI